MEGKVDYNLVSVLLAASRDNNKPSGVVYHYTSKEVIKHIFKPDALSFRLTKATKFKDKLEGVCGTAFWDLALEELAKERTISDDDRSKLELIKPTNTAFVYKQEMSEERLLKSGLATTYIGCFSLNGNSSYMVEEYIKNTGHEGIRIALDVDRLLDWQDEIGKCGYQASIVPVMYGREVIEYLKSKTRLLVDGLGGVDTKLFKENGIPVLESKLAQIKYMSKSGSFRREAECRIIVQVPRNKPRGLSGYEFEKDKKGIFFKIPKQALESLTFVNMSDESIDVYKKALAENGYERFLKD